MKIGAHLGTAHVPFTTVAYDDLLRMRVVQICANFNSNILQQISVLAEQTFLS